MSEKLTATEMTAAINLRERDMRARVLADSCVAMAMQELSDEAPDEYGSRQFAHRVAQLAATFLISGIYLGDAEMRALREERDAYKRQALEYARLSPHPLTVNLNAHTP